MYVYVYIYIYGPTKDQELHIFGAIHMRTYKCVGLGRYGAAKIWSYR